MEKEDCVDDPQGLVSSDPSKNCYDVGSRSDWMCDNFDDDFNGHATFIWELCPVSCHMCGTDRDQYYQEHSENNGKEEDDMPECLMDCPFEGLDFENAESVCPWWLAEGPEHNPESCFNDCSPGVMFYIESHVEKVCTGAPQENPFECAMDCPMDELNPHSPESFCPWFSQEKGNICFNDCSDEFLNMAQSHAEHTCAEYVVEGADKFTTYIKEPLTEGLAVYGESGYTCEGGFYLSSVTEHECSVCPAGMFSASGDNYCSECPVGLTSFPGATTPEDCYVRAAALSKDSYSESYESYDKESHESKDEYPEYDTEKHQYDNSAAAPLESHTKNEYVEHEYNHGSAEESESNEPESIYDNFDEPEYVEPVQDQYHQEHENNGREEDDTPECLMDCPFEGLDFEDAESVCPWWLAEGPEHNPESCFNDCSPGVLFYMESHVEKVCTGAPDENPFECAMDCPMEELNPHSPESFCPWFSQEKSNMCFNDCSDEFLNMAQSHAEHTCAEFVVEGADKFTTYINEPLTEGLPLNGESGYMCEAGFYLSAASGYECKVCPASTFSAAGDNECSDCPSGLTSFPGASSPEDCYVRALTPAMDSYESESFESDHGDSYEPINNHQEYDEEKHQANDNTASHLESKPEHEYAQYEHEYVQPEYVQPKHVEPEYSEPEHQYAEPAYEYAQTEHVQPLYNYDAASKYESYVPESHYQKFDEPEHNEHSYAGNYYYNSDGEDHEATDYYKTAYPITEESTDYYQTTYPITEEITGTAPGVTGDYMYTTAPDYYHPSHAPKDEEHIYYPYAIATEEPESAYSSSPENYHH